MRRGLASVLFPALFVMLVVVPIVVGVFVAVRYAFGWASVTEDGFTLAIWTRVLLQPDIWWSLAWSAVMSLAAVGASTALAFAALITKLDTRWVALLMAVPGTVAAFLVFHFGGAWLVKDPWGAGILVAHVLILAPFLTVLFTQAAQAVGLRALQDAARMCGATGRTTHRLVTWPVLWHRLRFHLLLLGIAFAGSFEIPLLLGRSWPEAVSVLAYNRFSRFSLETRPEAFVIVLVYMVLVGLLFAMAWRKTRTERA